MEIGEETAMIIAKIQDVEVRLRNQKWTGEDTAIVSLLNNWTETVIETATSGSPLFYVNSPEDPYPDYTIATEAVKVWGGEIIDEGEPPEYDPEDIY